jgi:hypothetical protein
MHKLACVDPIDFDAAAVDGETDDDENDPLSHGVDDLADDTKTKLTRLLGCTPGCAIVSVGGPATELGMLPGLVIDGKTVALPLESSWLARIKSLAAPSPCTRGLTVVVDTAVRSSKELSPDSQFHFANPKWDAAVQQLAHRVCGAMGCPYVHISTLHRSLLFVRC